MDSKVSEVVYRYEKEKMQEAYLWTDEQFDSYWNNPELNGYLYRKNELLTIARLAMVSTNSYNPDFVSPPGETLQELLSERGWNPSDLANSSALTENSILRLISGEAHITKYVAEELSKVLGGSIALWLNLAEYYLSLVSLTFSFSYLVVDPDGCVYLFDSHPERDMAENCWCSNGEAISLRKGDDFLLTGNNLTFQDEPYVLKILHE